MKEGAQTICIAIAMILTATITVAHVSGSDLGDTASELRPNMSILELSQMSFLGSGSWQTLGMRMARNPGDLNGDGYNDIVFGDFKNNSNGENSGRIIIIFGGPQLLDRENNLTEPDIEINGENAYDFLGSSLDIVGDVNNDGYDDILVGSPDYFQGLINGRAYLFFGKRDNWDSTLSAADADVIINGSSTMEYFGSGISNIGDVNSDGIDDIVLAAPYCSQGETNSCGKLYIIFGKNGKWEPYYSIEDLCDASYYGEVTNQFLSYENNGCGDVNGDGIDDIVVGARFTRVGESGYGTGRVYVIFGKTEGWSRESSIDCVDVKIDGENNYDYFGSDIAGRGDVNCDGLDDLVIGSPWSDLDGVNYGKAFLFFGRTTGWEDVTNATDADVTINGYGDYSNLGERVLISSDINSDGKCDVIVSSPNAPLGDRNGTIILIYGRETGWEETIAMDDADASIIGEYAYDDFGSEICSMGDVTGDGKDCILVSSPNNDEVSTNSGKIYLVTGNLITKNPPQEIYSLEAFDDEDMTDPLSIPDLMDRVYIKLTGKDGNSTTRDTAIVNITYSRTSPVPIRVPLKETSKGSGTYIGAVTVPGGCSYGELMNISSLNDPSFVISFTVDTPVRLNEIPTTFKVQQYEDFEIGIENLGYFKDPTWTFDTDAEWLSFDTPSGIICGTGMNEDIGKYQVTVKAEDLLGNSDQREFEVSLINSAPVITTDWIGNISEEEHYYVDFDCNEDGDGDIKWFVYTNASWLTIVEDSGELLGTPTNDEVGTYSVKVKVKDGNGGEDSRTFELNVGDVNDPPAIVTPDDTDAVQGELYRVDYELEDIDLVDSHEWSIDTDATWLEIDPKSGILKGVPENEDVGVHDVIVRVTDLRGLSDQHRFKIDVENVNDAPYFTEFPEDSDVYTGRYFEFDVDAADLDSGSELTFFISSKPFSNIEIDSATGMICWKGSIEWFTSTPYRMEVTIGVTDGEREVRRTFTILVKLTQPPVVELVYPPDEKRISVIDPYLEWSGFDEDGDEMTYDIYLGANKAHVLVKKDETLLCSGFSAEILDLSGLEHGKWYYWTVVPHDGGLEGTCENGVFSFKMNCPPQVEDLKYLEASVGNELKYRFICSDGDPEDSGNVRFIIDLGPAGLTIGETTGLLKWTPGSDQSGEHMVVVNITDGMDSRTVKFTIDVESSEEMEGSTNIIIGAIIGASVLISASLLGLMVATTRKRGRRKDKEEDKEPEEMVIGAVDDEEQKKVKCDVAITPTEAHSHLGKGSRSVTYEELYGIREEKIEEGGMTTRELKDFINTQIHELEKLEE
ncbi:MAG: putative Ig domain-containing protein [Thermoplasmatota archaeon]